MRPSISKAVREADSLVDANFCPIHRLELTRYDGSCPACCRAWARRKSEAVLAQLARFELGLTETEEVARREPHPRR